MLISRNVVDELVEMKQQSDKNLNVEDTGVLLASAARNDQLINNVSVQAVELEQGRQLEKIDKTDLMRA